MKINKTKIIVSTLALAMGAALAGSVSGTVAWFQYSTRAQATYIGSSAHCSEILEVSADNGSTWASELPGISSASGYGTKLEPITAIGATKDGAFTASNMKRNPIYQITDPSKWVNATAENYVEFSLKFHVKDVNGEETATYLSNHKLYLLDVDIVSLGSAAGTETSNLDLYKAIRVHVSTGTGEGAFNKLYANGSEETLTYGPLDLNNDTENDMSEGYSWTTGRSELVYGTANSKQTTYNAANKSIFASDADLNDIQANGHELGTISDSLTVTVRIWIEGWQKLGETPSAMWDPATYIGKYFGVGFRFGTDPHKVTE